MTLKNTNWLRGVWGCLLCGLVLSASPAVAELSLCKIFSDGMILQRDKPVKVWGWCTPGDTVTVKFADQTKTAVADDTGRWDVSLDPMTASAVNRTYDHHNRSGWRLEIH